MYCTNCGKKTNGGKFCSSCGNKLDRESEIDVNESVKKQEEIPVNEKQEKAKKEENINYNKNESEKVKDNNNNFQLLLSKNIDESCEKYKGGKKGMTLERYLNTGNLLPSMRTTSFLIPIILLSIPFTPIGGILIGGALGLFIYVFRCSRILRKENTLQAKCNYDIDRIKMVYNYMLNNKMVDDIVVDSYDEEGVNIIYRNQTHHKIRFYKNEGMYIVYCGRCTKVQYAKSGFQHSSSIMMRNSVLINPILRTYSEYAIKL